jgi:hypothetical protein
MKPPEDEVDDKAEEEEEKKEETAPTDSTFSFSWTRNYPWNLQPFTITSFTASSSSASWWQAWRESEAADSSAAGTD